MERDGDCATGTSSGKILDGTIGLSSCEREGEERRRWKREGEREGDGDGG